MKDDSWEITARHIQSYQIIKVAQTADSSTFFYFILELKCYISSVFSLKNVPRIIVQSASLEEDLGTAKLVSVFHVAYNVISV